MRWCGTLRCAAWYRWWMLCCCWHRTLSWSGCNCIPPFTCVHRLQHPWRRCVQNYNNAGRWGSWQGRCWWNCLLGHSFKFRPKVLQLLRCTNIASCRAGPNIPCGVCWFKRWSWSGRHGCCWCCRWCGWCWLRWDWSVCCCRWRGGVGIRNSFSGNGVWTRCTLCWPGGWTGAQHTKWKIIGGLPLHACYPCWCVFKGCNAFITISQAVCQCSLRFMSGGWHRCMLGGRLGLQHGHIDITRNFLGCAHLKQMNFEGNQLWS